MLRRISAALSVFALLLAGLAGVAGHEHLSEILRPTTECLVDHQAPHPDLEHAGAEPHFDPIGSKHEHHCIVCQQHRLRATPVACQTLAAALISLGFSTVLGDGQYGSLAVLVESARGPPTSSIS
jgi:hypothetical protein